ncbi:hypothetical protein IWQ61_006608 [Dispira simplex]|nr:hypothetical protein IWQ61_006608 [Dispira simplex]
MKWYLAVYKDRKTIILGCRGSTEKNFLTFLTNAVVSKKNWPPAASDSEVHEGFLDSIQVGMGKVRNALKLLVGEYPDFTITLTGHSLGGAQAVLAAIQIAMDNSQWKSKLRVYTFGEPRVGNTEFAQYYDSQGIPTRRVVNHNDLVPHLPSHAMNFTHHGGEVWIRSSDNQGVVCLSVYPDENADCSSGVRFYKRTLNDHTYRIKGAQNSKNEENEENKENDKVLHKCPYINNSTVKSAFVRIKDPSVGVFMAVDFSQEAIVLSFKGTDPRSKFRSAIDIHKTQWPPGEKSKVYRGALEGYQLVNKDLFTKHFELHKEYPAYTSYIVGHSIGGVQAVFYAVEYQGRIPGMEFKVVTFGMPKPGDSSFRALWEQKGISLTQVNNYPDSTPHLPPSLFKFQYLAPPIVVDPENNRTVDCAIAVKYGDTLCTQKPSLWYRASAHSSFWGEDGSVFGPKI